MRHAFTILLTAAGILSLNSSAFPQRNAAPAARVAVVELFTSEGCSSCPPADELLRRIDGQQIPSGQLVIALSEHVTYWNSLGWRDPFSAEANTERQNNYGARFGLDSVYTPQMVVNGSRQLVGSDTAALHRALLAENSAPTVTLSIHTLTRDGATVKVAYTLRGTTPLPRGVEIFAAIADDHDQSDVLHGENGGRTLQHVAVVRQLTRLQMAGDGDNFATVTLPSALGAGGHRLVLFVQRAGLGAILAADVKGF